MAQDLHVFCWGRALPSRKGLLDLGPRTTRNSASPEAKSRATTRDLANNQSTLHKVKESKCLPWRRLLANLAIAEAAAGKIIIATHARPILGRAGRPETPLPPLEVPVPARIADPIIL